MATRVAMIADNMQESQPDLSAYARIPISFDVREIMDVGVSSGAGDRYVLTPRLVASPWRKDYDAVDGGPLEWPKRFDLSFWTFFAAIEDGERAGGAVVIHGAPDIDMLNGRHDVAVVWDIRVAPAARRRGIGRGLMIEIEAWAMRRGVASLEVETQNINAPACRFYARTGFELVSVDPNAYPGLPDETQLIWRKRVP